jgi:subtilisin family serine protease
MDEAFCIYHAVENGADIISCSWGPEDGDPDNPEDPLHFQSHELPQHTRDAIHYAVTKGRGGRGCIVLFSAGNGNEDADQDAYIANRDIIAVAACNDRGTKTIYSDFGKCIFVCFPSNDWGGEEHPAPQTTGIWTTDRIRKKGYSNNAYTYNFGGTSSACPGVAGVCALILSVNPGLSARKVKEILKTTADKIDRRHGRYDARGHSIYYGYGRVNAGRAVALAKNLNKGERKKIVTKIVSLQPTNAFT